MGKVCHVTFKWHRWRCKNHDISQPAELAGSPVDFVSVAGLVWVLEV
jgi:hypothetical protein